MAWKNFKQLSLIYGGLQQQCFVMQFCFLHTVDSHLQLNATILLSLNIHVTRQKHGDWLEDHHVDNKVVERAYRNTRLTLAQKKKNQRNSGARCTVERVFGALKLHYGMGQARYWGLARNRIRFGVMCLAYNFRRGANINKFCKTSHYSCA